MRQPTENMEGGFPWEIERNEDLGNIYIRESKGNKGRVCRVWNERTFTEEHVKLIAAAPDLLEAVKKLMDVISDERGWGTYPRMEGSQIYVDASEAKKFVNAVLAKAEGRS